MGWILKPSEDSSFPAQRLRTQKNSLHPLPQQPLIYKKGFSLQIFAIPCGLEALPSNSLGIA
jgi:hypothetical protein